MDRVISKVNAYADDNLKEIIDLFTNMDKFVVIKSCVNWSDKWSYIELAYDKSHRGHGLEYAIELVTIAYKISIALFKDRDIEVESAVVMSNVTVEWRGDESYPVIRLEFMRKWNKEFIQILKGVLNGLYPNTHNK